MPEPITEFFNGGLVTRRHPALLKAGELQLATDCVYRDSDPAIWRAPGRTVYNSTALGSTPIKGLAHITFDGSRTDHLLAYVGTAIYFSPFTGTTGSFSELGGPGQVAGTVSVTVTFVATSGYPFLSSIVGARVIGTGINVGTIVHAVSGQDGTTGHYNTITLSIATTNGSKTLTFDLGLVQTLENTGEEILDIAQWQSCYFAWFNHGAPRRVAWRSKGGDATTGVLDDLLSMRPVGLDPVRVAPTVEMVEGATYRWNPVLGVGYYWFLITEIYAPGGDVKAAEKDANLSSEIIESAYLAPDPTASDPSSGIGRPIAVAIDDVSDQGVKITLPAVTNNGINGRLATNWGVYMYGPTLDGTTTPSYAQLRRIRAEAITQYTAGAILYVTEKVITADNFQQAFAVTHTSDNGQSEFESADFMLGAPDKQVAWAKSGSNTDSPGVQEAVCKLAGWGFSTSGDYATAGIVGIEVQVTGSADKSGNASDAAGYYMEIKTPAGKKTPTQFNVFKSYGTITHGGPLDTLGVAWVVGDLTTITVTIGKTGTAARQRLAIDAVKLKVYFSGGTINLNGPAYRVVTYRDQIGLTVNDPANLPPPDCSTGDVWMGSLVLNDLSYDSVIRYSLPGRPEAFPKPYFLSFETKKKDKVTIIKSLGQILLVGMENSIKRVNYLPRETDTDFQQGLAHEDLATDHGIPGPLAAAKFDMPGSGMIMIYASTAGMFLTDGITTRPATLDLDWANTINLSTLSNCILRIYPKEKWIILYYNPAGASHTKNTQALVFSYAMDKVKDGGFLPCTGPLTISARSACETVLEGSNYLLTGHESDGTIYVEDNGTAQAAGYEVHDLSDDLVAIGINPVIRTRKIYAAGMSKDTREERIYLLYSPYGSSSSVSCTTTAGSTTITSTAAFGSIVPGMRVSGTGIEPGTIVTAVASTSSLTISQAANTTGSGVSLSFDTGTLAITVRGSSIVEAVSSLDTSYVSTLTGDLTSAHNDNTKQGLELQIEKVVLPSGSSVDLGVNMRLHQFTIMANDEGSEQTRAVV